GVRKFGRGIEAATAPIMRQIGRLWETSALVENAVQFGKQYSVEMVWAVPCHPSVILIAQRVAQSLGAVLELMLWDPPELMIESLNYDLVSAQAPMRAFDNLLAAADRCIVASQAMKDEYERRFKIECKVMIYGPPANLRKPPSQSLKDNAHLFI